MKQTIIAILIALLAIIMFTLITPNKVVSAPDVNKPEQPDVEKSDQKSGEESATDDDEDDSDPEATS